MKRLAVRFFLLYALFSLLLFATGCGNWTTEASAIIALLGPAITSALAILASFGIGVSPTVLAAIQAWGASAQDALTNVIEPAIQAYNDAASDAKASLLSEIQAALNSIISNLTSLLADIHITDPGTQSKVLAIFTLISGFLTSLVNLIPVLQGKVTDTEKAKALVAAVVPPKTFKKEFNDAVSSFGNQFELQ
jgi:hypothetical protein